MLKSGSANGVIRRTWPTRAAGNAKPGLPSIGYSFSNAGPAADMRHKLDQMKQFRKQIEHEKG